ncbi:MAG TPA: IS701 family transposase [Ktedonobacterales bacterium]|jgi:SRSO17 transposase|nr:IS701 family transposase [Ktedonobacterales bacterium]
MPTPRKPTPPTTEAIDQFCAQFDDLFARYEERQALRQYLIGLLLPREHNKTLVELASIVPGARRQSLHHFLHDAPWDAEALNQRRLEIWQSHPFLGPHAQGVLIVDETGDPKRGHRIELVAQQYLGKLGHVAGGVVSVTSQWTDGTRQVPLGVNAYRPASRLPKGRKDPDFHTKPALAWQLIEEARAAGIPFRLVVADSIYGENADLEAKLFAAHIPYIMGLKPSHGTWQFVEDSANPPAFTPAEAAARLPLDVWQRTLRFDSHGKELVRYIAELELGPTYGPSTGIRLVAATLDPTQLKPESTWYLATSLPLAEVSAEQVYELYRLRDWIEHYYKPVKHELGWADYQMRPERAIVRHWQLVMLAYTFSLLVGAPPRSREEMAAGGKIGTTQRLRVRGAGHERRTGKSRGLESGATAGTGMALPLGSAAPLLATVVREGPTARTGRALRSPRTVSSS